MLLTPASNLGLGRAEGNQNDLAGRAAGLHFEPADAFYPQVRQLVRCAIRGVDENAIGRKPRVREARASVAVCCTIL